MGGSSLMRGGDGSDQEAAAQQELEASEMDCRGSNQ
jgi:hypothetical protein